MEIQFTTSSTKDALKFKYRYLIPNAIKINQYEYNKSNNFCYLFNNYNNNYAAVSMAHFNQTVSWHSFDMVLTEPSQISGMLLLKIGSSSDPSVTATSEHSSILIKVTKGSTEIIPIYASDSTINSSASYITVLIQNVHD